MGWFGQVFFVCKWPPGAKRAGSWRHALQSRPHQKATQQKEGRNGGRVHECNPAHHYQKLCCVLEPQGPQHCQATRRSARAKLPNSRTAYLITAATQPGMLRGQGGGVPGLPSSTSAHPPASTRQACQKQARSGGCPCVRCVSTMPTLHFLVPWLVPPAHRGRQHCVCGCGWGCFQLAGGWQGPHPNNPLSVAPLIPSRPFG